MCVLSKAGHIRKAPEYAAEEGKQRVDQDWGLDTSRFTQLVKNFFNPEDECKGYDIAALSSIFFK